MPEHANDPLDAVVDLIKQVQPALQETTITRDQSVVDDLGLDSLDLVQLTRRIGRDLGCDFDLDSWNSEAQVHHRSVGSIVNVVSAAVSA